MGRSPFFARWRTCPACAADLRIEGARAECRACGLVAYANPAPTVSAVLVGDGRRVLLARRGVEPRKGLWDLPGGFMHEGEEPLETLVRELREETGLELEPLEFLGGLPDRYGDDGIWTMNLYWSARIVSGEPSPADDVTELAWFDPDELPPPEELAFANTVRALGAWQRRASF